MSPKMEEELISDERLEKLCKMQDYVKHGAQAVNKIICCYKISKVSYMVTQST